MVAPFWADVDTRNSDSGLVYYKVEATRVTVIWDHVGYFGMQADLRNTFKLVITNGSDPLVGVGNNVGFYYGDMQWTTGSASGGKNGFGGTPATVGANTGRDDCFFFQLGRFNQPGADATNLQTGAGVDFLDNRCFFFDVSTLDRLALDFTSQQNGCTTTTAATFSPGLSNPQNCQIMSYEWSFGDGGSATESNPIHTYTRPGTYPVSLTVRYKCSACRETSISQTKSITILPNVTPALDFTYRKYVCATIFSPALSNPQNCQVTSYNWSFGDGGSSNEADPMHAYAQPGTYPVRLTVSYKCGACDATNISQTKSVTILPDVNPVKDTVLTVLTQEQEQVLQTTASTFSDVWPLAYDNKELGARNSYLNGAKGVWRNEGTYVYQVDRQASAPVKTATDGTFTAEQFNWPQAELNAIPHWIKAESKTLYSPSGYELENRDALGVYSAALYDYGGHLPSANGVNTRHAEMAFTSFEHLDGNPTGNWVFGTRPLSQYSTYPVNIGVGQSVLVEARLSELEGVTKVDVQARAFGLFFPVTNYQEDVDVVCKQAHPTKPAFSLLVLKRAPFGGVWFGNLRVRNQVNPGVEPDVDTTYAHAGRSSLRITTIKTFQQPQLQLETGKSYLLSAWVSVKNSQVQTPKLADDLGVSLTFKNAQGTLLANRSVLFEPAGPVIEGWQQVRGVFTCPDKDAKLEVTFRPGSTGTAWYDDLRLHPEKGNMKSYVYQLNDYRLRAILDEENFASFFYYDAQGNLYLTKKETEEGIKTLTENVNYLKGNGN
ncbi:PKD domain-containing protein [Hymenobacter sp. BT664]|uniref:PKD domain-containing protein n=2 Tax=Hymenobacter montanus TaxID=2771359 RepID=A0A927BE80_9BACT|nr:PKD domain-containing protein [Hymenobacter montanus]MBD2769220.1 PKD domain-containing protein [Hymenobacter montanus]